MKIMQYILDMMTGRLLKDVKTKSDIQIASIKELVATVDGDPKWMLQNKNKTFECECKEKK